MIDNNLIFLLIYEQNIFVDLSDGYSPNPPGYFTTKEIIKEFTTMKDMDEYISDNILGKSQIVSYRRFQSFPIDNKIKLKDEKI